MADDSKHGPASLLGSKVKIYHLNALRDVSLPLCIPGWPSYRSHFCEEESEERRDFSKGRKKIKMSGEKLDTLKK